MEEEDKAFGAGLISGAAIALVVFAAGHFVNYISDRSGYRDRMTIEYRCPEKEYERKMFLDMVNGSGILTNFIDKNFSMDKYMIRYRLTNPK